MSLSTAFRSALKGIWSNAPTEFNPEGNAWSRSARRLDVRRDCRREPASSRGLSPVPLLHQIFAPAA
jgi:hypothetical protein